MYKIIDLFGGCGGLSLGFKKAGFDVIAGFDINDAALQTYKENIGKAYKLDLSKATPADILNLARVEEIDGIVGGPPCEGFSLANIRRKIGDPRNMLVFKFAGLIKEIQPTFFVMENVVGLTNLGGGFFVNELRKRFKEAGYEVKWSILNSADYGVPQFRRRVIFIGIKRGEGLPDHPKPTHYPRSSLGEKHYVTVWEAISDLPEPTEDGEVELISEPSNEYQKMIRNGAKKTTSHFKTHHSREIEEKLKRLRFNESLYPKFKHSWVRLNPKEPAPTFKENHNAPAVHPFQPRVITPREGARIQSFPDTFVFCGTKSQQLVQIGDAVPPLMALAIARKVRQILDGTE
ncbi:MAG: DNA cytosine methyltransferase [Candidatus Aenigmatarchaeota archaeon]